MIENEIIEEAFECFEGDLRKLDELVAQLELWSDTHTRNHKKEQTRLEEYVELSKNLYDLQEELYVNLENHTSLGLTKEVSMEYKNRIEEKFKGYKKTEAIIHNWIKQIEDMTLFIMRSRTLFEHKEYLEKIVQTNL